MKTIRFNRDTNPQREGGPGYKAGDVVTLKDDSANRWIRRSAADLATDLKLPPPPPDEPPPPPPPPPAPVVEPPPPPPPTVETSDGNTLGSATDVGGTDGSGTGDRPVIHSGTSGNRSTLRVTGNSRK